METEDFECKRILLNGKKVEYYDEGEGQPILLIHGWMYSKIIFIIIIKRLLKDGFRVIAPDMPGFGNSEEFDDVHSPENYSEFLDRFVSKLGIKKFVLFGPSMGGIIALNYIIKHKEKVQKLIVQAPFFYGKQSWFSWKLRLLTNLTGTLPLIRNLVYKITVSPRRMKNEENFLLKKTPKKYSGEIEQIVKESDRGNREIYNKNRL